MITRERLIVIVIGTLLSIPTSVLGYQLMGFKFLKQELDCVTDTYNVTLDWFSSIEQGSAGRELGNINSNLKSCVKRIDARKGTIEFAVEQYKRYQ